MRTTIEAKHLEFELPAAVAEQIDARLDELAARYRFVEAAHVVVTQQRSWFSGEITLHVKHQILRAEERSNDLGTAVDSALDKLERQLHRHKGRLVSRSRVPEHREAPPLLEVEVDQPDEKYDTPRVVRVKRIPVKPMSPEEAALQMDLLGHDFYVFKDAESEELNVVYRRRSGDYGLIQPE